MTEHTIPRPQPDTGGDGDAPAPAVHEIVDALEYANGLVSGRIVRTSSLPPIGAVFVRRRAALAWLASHLPELMAARETGHSFNWRRLEVLANRIEHICDNSHPIDEKHLRGDAAYLRKLAQPGRAPVAGLTQGGRSNG